MLQQLLRRQASCPAPHGSPKCILAAQHPTVSAAGFNTALSIGRVHIATMCGNPCAPHHGEYLP